MNTIYEPTLSPHPINTRVDIRYDDAAVRPLGTFAGTIYKALYRSNERLVPSDTREQLIADGLKPFKSVGPQSAP
jgi:hypothetical protein